MVVHAIETDVDRPRNDLISAVFLIALQGENILSVRNERGWDIPGGHVEPGETPVSALNREVLEEASATFTTAEPFSFVTVPHRRDLMLFFVTQDFQLYPFLPSHQGALERAIVPIEVFLARYYGPKGVLGQLLTNAKAFIRRTGGPNGRRVLE